MPLYHLIQPIFCTRKKVSVFNCINKKKKLCLIKKHNDSSLEFSKKKPLLCTPPLISSFPQKRHIQKLYIAPHTHTNIATPAAAKSAKFTPRSMVTAPRRHWSHRCPRYVVIHAPIIRGRVLYAVALFGCIVRVGAVKERVCMQTMGEGVCVCGCGRFN